MGEADGGPGTGNYWWWSTLGPCLGSRQHRRDGGGRSLSKFSQLCWDPRPSRSTLLRATATLVLLDELRSVWVAATVENC
jgi:hypothetical protein